MEKFLDLIRAPCLRGAIQSFIMNLNITSGGDEPCLKHVSGKPSSTICCTYFP